MMEIIYNIRYALWGPFTVLLILGTGIYLTFKSEFVQFWAFKRLIKMNNTQNSDGISPWQALCTSLGGTLGVGNLAGVAIAIELGGAGAVFYMLLAAFFGMATKYSELMLAVHFQTKDKVPIGGPMVYLQNGAGLTRLAKFFAVCCVISAAGTGAAAQGSAVAQAMNEAFNMPSSIVGVIMCALLIPIVYGGGKRIANALTVIVPLMTVSYIIMGIIVMITHKNQIIPALNMIIDGVMQPLSAGGGIIGFLTSRAISDGFAKGVFSNEAGMGSAPIAHGSTKGVKPCEEGILGAVEVFLDTFIVCMVTALVILVSGANESSFSGLAMTTHAFSTVFGVLASDFISVIVVFLAVSTVLGWSFYGITCLRWLKAGRLIRGIYPFIIALSAAFASKIDLSSLLILCDIMAAWMALPNLYGLWILAPVVKRQTKAYLKK